MNLPWLKLPHWQVCHKAQIITTHLRHPEKAEKRRNIVLKLMEKAGFITAEEHEKAQAESVKIA